VELLKKSAGGETALKIFEPPSCFGEIAVLDGLPRSATIRATKESVVLRVPQERFNELVEQNHLTACKLIRQMALTLAARQRSNTDRLSALLSTQELPDIREGIREIVIGSSAGE
jgi:CRP-like cAMP-binding protein